MGGIDLRGGDVAKGLLQVYDYALREVRANRFDYAETLMSELAEAYRQVLGGQSEVRAAAA